MMKVDAGTNEYQQSIRKAKDSLIRLHKGKRMLDEAVRKQEYVKSQEIIHLWKSVAEELFVELEIATLIHQSIMTGNKVVGRADASLVKFEDLADPDNIEMDPWTLLSLEKIKGVFGDDVHQFIELKPSDEKQQS